MVVYPINLPRVFTSQVVSRISEPSTVGSRDKRGGFVETEANPTDFGRGGCLLKPREFEDGSFLLVVPKKQDLKKDTRFVSVFSLF